MDQILLGVENVSCYLDDISVGGKSFENCKKILKEVLNRLNIHKVRINVGKCIFFFEKEVKYLGHIISNRSF